MAAKYKAHFYVINDQDARACDYDKATAFETDSLEGEDIGRPIPANAVRLDYFEGNQLMRRVFFKGRAMSPSEIDSMDVLFKNNPPKHAVFVDELKRVMRADAHDQILRPNGAFHTIGNIHHEAPRQETLDDDFEPAARKAEPEKPKLRREDFPEIAPQIIPVVPDKSERKQPRYIPGITDRKLH